MSERFPIHTLNKFLEADFEAGLLIWRPRGNRSFDTRYSGKPALHGVDSSGYRVGSLLQSRHYAHRVLWAMFYGVWPQMQIDHINRDRSDNRIANLREVDQSANVRNMGLKRSNRSGHTGVSREAQTGQWKAQIWHEGRMMNLGRYDDLAAAIAARKAAEASIGWNA